MIAFLDAVMQYVAATTTITETYRTSSTASDSYGYMIIAATPQDNVPAEILIQRPPVQAAGDKAEKTRATEPKTQIFRSLPIPDT